jgi:putative transposase
MKRAHWARLLAYITGMINQELLLRNEYLAAENRILRAQIQGRLRLSDPERATLAEIGSGLGEKPWSRSPVSPSLKPFWAGRKLIAKKFDGSKFRSYPGRPRLRKRIEDLVVQFARETSHMSVMAGIDFFTVEVLNWRGLATYYVLFLIHLDTRRVTLAGVTRHPTEEWMQQIARN